MDEYTSMGRVWELLLPGLPEEVSRARRWTRDLLHDTPCADDAALIVTELGANAVTHTTSPAFRLTITRTAEAITIAVTDTGSSDTSPRLYQADDHSTHGRGLSIVTTLAAQLTVTPTPQGHTVTAHLPTEATHRPCALTRSC
ncbi:ATP-binding protein [Streptomyces sp. JJ66]|uniref:ATP-binding protein n=1 Tax=Streptomyces sp. JJ66 TaxID=2803843 RepID=UPI001C5847AD|nr:ATP-binding protein [Streptomyces sp. JJ66]MBW1604133.1 ATP-binding protein [Streptomyces sp. JJ66]